MRDRASRALHPLPLDVLAPLGVVPGMRRARSARCTAGSRVRAICSTPVTGLPPLRPESLLAGLRIFDTAERLVDANSPRLDDPQSPIGTGSNGLPLAQGVHERLDGTEKTGSIRGGSDPDQHDPPVEVRRKDQGIAELGIHRDEAPALVGAASDQPRVRRPAHALAVYGRDIVPRGRQEPESRPAEIFVELQSHAGVFTGMST